MTKKRIKYDEVEPQRLLGMDEAATYLGLSSWALRTRLKNGLPLPVVRMGRRILFDIHDLNIYIEQNKTLYRPILRNEGGKR